MANGESVARLALVIDGTGARREVQLTVEQLKQLANGGKLADASLRQIGNPQTVTHINRTKAAMQDMQRATQAMAMANAIRANDPFQGQQAQKATFNFNRLRESMTTLAVVSGGLPGPIGRVGSALAPLALGGGITVAVLAGIAALSFAWRKFTEEGRNAKALMSEMREMEGSFSPRAQEARLAALKQKEADLAKQLDALQSQGGGVLGIDFKVFGVGGINDLTAKLKDVRDHYGELADAVAEYRREIVLALQAEDRIKRQFATQTSAVAGFGRAAELAGVRNWMNPTAGIEERAFAERQRAELTFAIEAEKAKRQYSGEALQAKLASLDADRQDALALSDQNAEYDKILVKAKQIASAQQAAASWVVGKVAGTAGPFGGMISGVGSAILAPGGANIPLAAVAAVTGLIDGIMGLGEAAKQQERQMAALRRQYEEFTDSMKVMAGTMSPVEAQIRAVQRQFQDMRDQLKAGLESLSPSELANAIPQYIKDIEALRRLEAETLRAVVEQAREAARAERERIAAHNLELQEDARVRALRALGQTEEADALAMLLEHQRELNRAREEGATAETLALIQQAQHLERIAAQMEKVKAKIDSLTGTIDSLQMFRDSLLLSATRSPEDRFAEAQRQYNAVLDAARGHPQRDRETGEMVATLSLEQQQAAAARLPQAAQSFLDAAREMFGSGRGFQDAFGQVLTDNQALIDRFTDLRTIEQLMLDELRLIQQHTLEARPDRREGGPFGATQGGSGAPMTVVDAATFGAVQAVGLELSKRLDDLTDQVETLSNVTKRGYEAIAAGKSNV